MSKTPYVEIADHRVAMLWECPYCNEDGHKVHAWYSPDWYQDNGTPACECGADLDYVRTEICLDGLDT